jgi:hypothetical protein
VTNFKNNVRTAFSRASTARWLLLTFALLLVASLNIINLHAQTTATTSAQNTTFSFTLDEPCKTSAGIYTTNGVLVRTLWSKVRYYAAGNYTTNWDGNDNNGNPVPAGTYVVKVLQNNVEYVWDGAVGNTSTAMSGPTVHSGFYPIQDMSFSGTNGFYLSGYNEGKYDFRNFWTTDPQQVQMAWTWVYNPTLSSAPANITDLNWNCTTADSNRVYLSCSGSYNTNGVLINPGCVISCYVSNNAAAAFTDGEPIINGTGTGSYISYQNGIFIGTQAGLSGMAVQINSNLLAVAVAPDNKIYLIDKTIGSPIGSISVNDPGRMSFSKNGNLWVTTSNAVICYSNMNGTPTVAATITTGLVEPLAVAANSTNPDLVLVADGGSSQQIKAFDTNGDFLWTYGLAGGYMTNGPSVNTNKFCFYSDTGNSSGGGSFITFAADGTFWVGDYGDHRVMHFSVPGNYIEQIMYQPFSYATAVDPNNPSRVFNQFLEFSVDYTKPPQQSWTLVNNWGANLPPRYFNAPSVVFGLLDVTTFTNGLTYGLVCNTNTSPQISIDEYEICQLTTKGLQFTGNRPAYTNYLTEGDGNIWVSIGPDGSIRKTVQNSATWYEPILSGFDASNNPIYGSDFLLASAPNGTNDPVPRNGSFGNINAPITTNNILISFDQSLNNGYHLGGIKLGTTNWLWEASLAGDLNGLGNYEIDNSLIYAGNTEDAAGRNIIYGYNGEFFRGQSEAGQHMHFYDDGLFVGQFGEADNGYSASEGAVPGFAGNAHCATVRETTNGQYYVWDNDESDHGPQRWCLVNTANIREETGSGILGGNIIVTDQPAPFPIGLIAEPGNQSASLSWLPGGGAILYNVYSSTNNGGPYLTPMGQAAGTNFITEGLANGVTYYFAITSVSNGTESIPSEQAAVMPFNTNNSVPAAGEMTDGWGWTPVIDVNTNALASGYPSYAGNEHLAGVLGLNDLCNYGFGNLPNVNVGTKGYAIFDWGGPSTNIIQVSTNFTITEGSGWSDIYFLVLQERLIGTENYNVSAYYPNIITNDLGTKYGLLASPTATININANTNFHYLTVVSPAKFSDARTFTMTLTSTNGTSASYTVSENPGLSHTFQFIFSGNATLTASGTDATVQAIFLDDAAVMASGPVTNSLSPPSKLRVEPNFN